AAFGDQRAKRAAHVGCAVTGGLGRRAQARAATDPNAHGGEFFAPRYMNTGPPVRRPILRRVGLDKAIDRLWALSERETGLPVEPAAVMGAARA
ncbi:MAG: hypothetical protein ACKOTH_11475, partial [Solirubrobacterales bacterium]